MLRTIGWLTYFWGYLIAKLPMLWKINKMEKGSSEYNEFLEHYVADWATKLLNLAGAKVTVEGEENLPTDRHAVYIGNHQGNFDIPLMLAHIGKPRAIMSKIEMENLFLVSKWMNHLNCVYVDRKNPKQALKIIVKVIKYVKEGNSFTMFPEGTRSQSDKIGEFKAGSSTVAIKGGALIVPVTIDGSYKLLEKNKGFKITPADVKLTIHKPIDPKALSKEQLENIDNMLRDIIREKLPNKGE